MRRPRFDRRVRDGLASLAALVDASSCEDILGVRADDASEEWENVLLAVEWIRYQSRRP